jgi:hypothetical protein
MNASGPTTGPTACLEARLTLLPTAEGGKTQVIRHGYRGGLLVFREWADTWGDDGKHVGIGAALRLLDRDEFQPGESAIVRFYFWAPEGLDDIDTSPGTTFRFWEGRFVGEGEIIRQLDERWPG